VVGTRRNKISIFRALHFGLFGHDTFVDSLWLVDPGGSERLDEAGGDGFGW
jgi:hypothetical protein